MGRSVSIPSGAQVVAFNHIEYEDEHDDWSYDDFVADARVLMQEISPSMSVCDSAFDREGRVVAYNDHAQMVISEYCGLVSLALVPEENGLAAHWCAQIAPKFMAAFSRLELIGRASNGEAFFRKVG